MPGLLRRMRDHLGLTPRAPGAVFGLSRGAAALLLLWTAYIVFAEFTLDLQHHPLLRASVVVADVLLVIGFSGWIAIRAFFERADPLGFAYRARIDLLILFVSLVIVVFDPRASAIFIIGRIGATAGPVLFGTRWGRLIEDLTPSQTIALSFLGLIALGSILMMLPAATVDGKGASLTDAVFTMASATSGTGLIVQDTGTYFTKFGLGVLVFVMQTGALGIMVLAAAFAFLLGGRLPERQQEGLNEAGFGDLVDVRTIQGLKRLAIAIGFATVVIELLGALILFIMWGVGALELRAEYDAFGPALWWCVFHSVSAFCNAGFSLEPDSMMRYVDNASLGMVFMVLITLGGVGFPVLVDLWPARRTVRARRTRLQRMVDLWRGFHIQTKVVLWSTAFLYVLGTLGMLFFEYDGILRELPLGTKISAALFQTVTLRSAGFNTVSWESLTPPTLIMSSIFMFIGSAPGSTGGGVRVTTVAVVLMAVRTMLRGRDDVELYGRTLPKTIVYRSISIVLIGGGLILGTLVAITATQPLPFDELVFETFSAFGTVGLTMGITSDLDVTGRWILAAAMYFGRVGPITLALAIGERVAHKAYRYPEGRIAVG